jgi:hypothetical protein
MIACRRPLRFSGPTGGSKNGKATKKKEENMFLRVSTYQVDPSKVDDMDAKIDEVREKLSGLAGLKHASAGRDENGNAATIAIWESEEAANAAEETVSGVWASIGHLLTAPPERRACNTYFNLAGHSF